MSTTVIQTRYPECDMMGIVHHAVYPLWYEMARMDFFAEVGFPFEDMRERGVNPAMVDMRIQYRAPAGYPQTLRATVRLGECAPRKLELLYEIADEGGAVINEARTFHVWTGPDGKAFDMKQNLPGDYEKFARKAGGQCTQ
ncbi:MAG: acyl-CoA thioesterase [Oscillospiraceae bacterium]|nr:acyl-CoA thioesterase [Oscillospiraceae bacterium]